MVKLILLSCLCFCFENDVQSREPLHGNSSFGLIAGGHAKFTDDLVLEKEVSQAIEALRDCPHKFDQSGLRDESSVDDKGRFFFEAQFLVINESGEPSFSSAPVARISVGHFINQYSIFSGLSRSDILALPDAQLRAIMTMYPGIPGLSPSALSDAVDSAMVIKGMSQFNNVHDALNFMVQELGDSSFSKKVSFLATYLDTLLDNYEYDMLKGGPTYGEDRWDEDLHLAMKQTIENGGVVEAGVCRHMHQMAVRMARKLGIDEAFGVGFRTIGNGHRTMVLTDPNNPGRVIQLNYGRVSSTNGLSGSAALSQNGTIPDTGIRFRINSSEDELVLNLPSELGGMLNRVSGGEDRDLDYRYQDRSQIVQTGVNTPYGTVRLFYGSTPMGNQMQAGGVSYNGRATFNDIFYSEVGITGFTSQRPTEIGMLSNNGVYFRATQGVDYEIFKGENLTLRVFGEQHSRASVFKSEASAATLFDENQSRVNGDYQLDYQLGLALDYRGDDVSSRTSVMTHGFFDQINSSNGHRWAPKLTTLNVDQNLLYSVNPSLDLSTGVGVTIYDLGTGIYGTYHSNVGAESSSTGTSVNVTFHGRLTRDTPFWLPAAEHAGRLQARQELLGGMFYIGLDGRQSFDFSKYRYFGVTLGGKFGEK